MPGFQSLSAAPYEYLSTLVSSSGQEAGIRADLWIPPASMREQHPGIADRHLLCKEFGLKAGDVMTVRSCFCAFGRSLFNGFFQIIWHNRRRRIPHPGPIPGEGFAQVHCFLKAKGVS